MPYVEVEVSLYEFDDRDLIEELQDRGFTVIRGELCDADELKELHKDYKAYGFTDKFKTILDDFFEGL